VEGGGLCCNLFTMQSNIVQEPAWQDFVGIEETDAVAAVVVLSCIVAVVDNLVVALVALVVVDGNLVAALVVVGGDNLVVVVVGDNLVVVVVGGDNFVVVVVGDNLVVALVVVVDSYIAQ
jgi:hypothetical protein